MEQALLKLARNGQWGPLLELLGQHSELTNTASEPKGYTPLHQAAWHGSHSSVVGALLAYGANPTLRTMNKSLTARAIALERHPDREDLHFLLADRGRTASQLVRKVVAQNAKLFGAYDANRIICDRLVEALGTDICCQTDVELESRVVSAFEAVTGNEWLGKRDNCVYAGPSFQMSSDQSFWSERFLPEFRRSAAKAQVTPLEQQWTTMVDLFDPIPNGWGSRGDLFLWREMTTAFNHVPIPECAEEVLAIVSAQFRVMTGASFEAGKDVQVERFKRGGMSSGWVCSQFWRESLIPLLQQRARLLHEIWKFFRTSKDN